MSDLPVLTTAGPDDPRAWVRIARAVIAGIHAGKLQPGDRLPGITTMAAQFGVSTKTVSRAGRELTTAGILTRNPGGPLRVPLDSPARPGPGDAAPQAPDKTAPPVVVRSEDRATTANASNSRLPALRPRSTKARKRNATPRWVAIR